MLLSDLLETLSGIRHVVDDMPIQQVHVLVAIAEGDESAVPLSISSLAEKCGISMSAASRAVRRLANPGARCYGGDSALVEIDVDGVHRVPRLTLRGKALVRKFAEV